jgi:ABC-type nitrate/sulfonate/bicarbonate transport system ATPase subunit
MAGGSAIELRRVSKWFPLRNGHRLYAVQDLSLEVRPAPSGEIVVLLGPSGCGKTTILKLISGLLLPDEGDLTVDGERLPGPGRKSTMVPQGYTCFPWLSVLRNVEFGLDLERIPRKVRHEVAMHYLERVGLADRFDALPKQLSSGMQQRVAIARTLAMRRSIVLMDEPFGALDAQTRSDMQELLLELWHAERNLIVFVTHDVAEALYIADRVVVFSPRPARVQADIRPKFLRPRTEALQHSAQFIQYREELRQMLRANSAIARVDHV